MSNSKMLVGSICITDLMAAAKAAHSSCTRAKNGKAYADIVLWVNDTPDQYGNTVSIQLNSKKEQRETEGKVYIGNAKPLPGSNTAAPAQDSAPEFEDDLPF